MDVIPLFEFERLANWMSKCVRHSYSVSNIEISRYWLASPLVFLLFFFRLLLFVFCSSYNNQSRNFDAVTEWGTTTDFFLPFKESKMLLSLFFLIFCSFLNFFLSLPVSFVGYFEKIQNLNQNFWYSKYRVLFF